jgi:hypothetical protein
MADNKTPGNKPMNSFGLSDIEKIGQTAYFTPKSEQHERMRAATAQEQLNLLQDIPEDVIAGSGAMSRIAKTAPNTLRSAETRIESSVGSRLDRANLQVVNAIGRRYAESTINGQAKRMAEDRDVQSRSLGMMGSSYEDLNQRRDTINGQIQELGNQSAYAARGLFGEQGKRGNQSRIISQNAQTAFSKTQEIAAIDVAQRAMRQSGNDPLSKYENLTATGKAAQDMMSAKALGSEIASGGVNVSRDGRQEKVANKDIGSALGAEAEKLSKIFEQMAKTGQDNIEALSSLRKQAEESAQNFEKLKQAQGAGGGNNYGQYAQYAQAAGGMFNAAGSAIQQIGVNQRLGQVGNVQGFSNIENNKYDMYKSGRGGDVMSQMLLGQYGKAEQFGSELHTATNVANTAFLAGSAATGVAGGFQMAEAGAQKANPLAYASGASTSNTQAMLGGAQNVVQGVAGVATTGMDMYRGVSAGQAQIQGTQAQMEARRAVLKVQAEQLQGFRDFGVGMGVAAQGMGGRGEAFLQNSMSDKSMQNMVGARMSPEQMAQMSASGVSSMGSQFQTSQVFAARNLERSGNGSMAENMQRMASLAGAGSNNPQAGLSSVLESAFSKSLDSSKALTMVAENTGALVASGSARAMGIDTTGAAAAISTAGINKSDPNQEYAVNRSMQVQDVVNRNGTDQGVNFAAMAATARINKMTGLSGTQSIIAQGFSDTDLRGMRDETDKSKVAEGLRMRGINVKGGDDAARLVSQLSTARVMTNLTQGGTGIATGASQYADKFAREVANDPSTVERLIAAQKTGKYESNSQKQFLQSSAEAAGLQKVGLDEYLRSAAGVVGKSDTNSVGKASDAMKDEGGSGTLKTLDDLRTSGFKQLSEAALQAALQATKSLGGTAAALKTLAELSGNFEKMGASGAEGKFSTAAGDSAATFGSAATKFDVAVDRFAGIMEKAGLGKDSTSDRAKKTMDKVTSSSSGILDKKKGR